MEDELKGEVEIEKISTRVIEARSKHLIPVSDYLQSPKPQAARCFRVLSYSFQLLVAWLLLFEVLFVQ